MEEPRLAIDLKSMPLESLRLLIPVFHTQKLFDCALQIHQWILKSNKYHNVDGIHLAVQDLVRKKSMLEN